jgi:hypothetical protein
VNAADQRQVLRWALYGGAFLMIVVGAFVFLTVDEVAGIVVGGVGVLDLLLMRFVLRAVARSSPDENPYARED